jgi:hypothetical protein
MALVDTTVEQSTVSSARAGDQGDVSVCTVRSVVNKAGEMGSGEGGFRVHNRFVQSANRTKRDVCWIIPGLRQIIIKQMIELKKCK